MRPITELEQGMFFLWLRQNLPEAQSKKLRNELPKIADAFLEPETVCGIPAKFFNRVKDLCKEDNRISAIRELRTEFHWTLKESKDFIDQHFPSHA